jgi:hypothetical protein
MSTPAPAVTQSANDALANVAGKANELAQKVMSSPSLMIASVFIIFLLIFVVVYVYVKFKSRIKYYNALSKPLYLFELGNTVLSTQAFMPIQSNGPVFTYAFWLYANNLVNTSDYKLLWRRENNPIVYMEPNSSSVHIKLLNGNGKLNGVTDSADLDATLHSNTCDYLHMKIDYVPLQRWTHIVVSVDTDHVVLYVDGELYKVVYLNTEKSACVENEVSILRSPSGISNTTGDLVAGHSSKYNTPDAIISRLVFFDNSITHQDVKGLYGQGPISNSALSKLGVPVYGMRNPFYRIDKVAVE